MRSSIVFGSALVALLCACQSGGASSGSASTGLAISSSGAGSSSGATSSGAASSTGSGVTSSSTSAGASGTNGTSTGGASSTGGLPPVSTLAGGGGITCFDGDGGFDAVHDVRLGPTGEIYVIGGEVYEVTLDGGISIVIPSSVLPTMAYLAVGPTGDLFLSASNPTSIFSQIYQIDGSSPSLFAGNGGPACGDTGSDAGVGFGLIHGMIFDVSGALWVAEETYPPLQACDNIRRISPDGTTATVAGSGTPGFANGSASQAQFSQPSGIVVDSQGNLIVADSGNNRIRKIAPDGTTSTLAGNGASSYQDGSGLGVAFNTPWGLTIDGQDNVYVADLGNNRIRKVTPQGLTTTVAGNGTPGLMDGTLGPNGTAEFDIPGGLAVNAMGTALYVADVENCALRVITLSSGSP
jgi:hypothetical protein